MRDINILNEEQGMLFCSHCPRNRDCRTFGTPLFFGDEPCVMLEAGRDKSKWKWLLIVFIMVVIVCDLLYLHQSLGLSLGVSCGKALADGSFLAGFSFLAVDVMKKE